MRLSNLFEAPQKSGPADREVLFKGEWINVVKLGGWYDIWESPEPVNGTAVAVLAYRNSDVGRQYVGRFEWCPAHSPTKEFILSALTGGTEADDPRDDAIRELEEEAGVRGKTTDDLIDLGDVFISKNSTTKIKLFAIEVDEIGESTGDGTKGEEDAYCKWVSEEDLIWCKDPCVQTMLVRLKSK